MDLEKQMAQHYLRSRDNYDHEFLMANKVTKEDGTIEWKIRLDETTAQPERWILKGRAHDNKNISIIETDDDFEFIMSFEQIKQLMKRHVVEEIKEIPNTYYSAMEIASKNAEMIRQSEIDKKIASQTIQSKDQRIVELEEKLRQAGIE
jgi:hypothetical protein